MSANTRLVCYQFGEWLFEPHLNQLRRGEEICQLEYRGVEVLRYLLDHSGQIVPVTDLLDAVWADRVVEPNVIHRNLSRIRQALGDDPHNPTYIETISKRGYRTIATVEISVPSAIQKGKFAAIPQELAPTRHTFWKKWVFVISACIATVALAMTYFPLSENPVPTPLIGSSLQDPHSEPLFSPPARSVAVLPFKNLSPDTHYSYFAAGVHQEIINHLVSASDLLIIARGSVVAYAQQDKSIQQIAADLGVAAVLTGSVLFEDDQVRLAVQLIDGQSAVHLWSQTFERELVDIFNIQDDIAANITEQLNATLINGTRVDKQRNPEAYLLRLQATHLLDLGGLKQDRVLRAEALLEKALEIAPKDTAVILQMVRVYLQKEQVGLAPQYSTAQIRQEMTGLALTLDPNNGVAYAWAGWIAMLNLRDMALSAQHYQQAMALAPNDPDVTRALSILLLHIGRVADAKRLAQATVALDPLCVICLQTLAASQLQLADYENAVANARTALSLEPNQLLASMTLGNALLLSGKPAAASAVFDTVELPYYRTALLAMAQHDLGLSEESEASRTMLLRQWPQSSLLIGTLYAYIGEIDLAFNYLDRAAAEGIDNQRVGFHGGPSDMLLTNLKQDPRWIAFLEKSKQAPDDLAEFDFKLNMPQ